MRFVRLTNKAPMGRNIIVLTAQNGKTSEVHSMQYQISFLDFKRF